MKVVEVENYEEMSIYGAEVIRGLVERKPDLKVVLAVGNSPSGTYKELARLKEIKQFNTRSLHVFQLDGYLGLDADDPRSLERWVREEVIGPWEISEDRFTPLKEKIDEPEEACREYVEKVKEAGGFDLAVLGLGPNGHLGFNEPPSALTDVTRIVPLTEESLVSNAVYWGGIENVPPMSITAGMDLLLAARTVILLVNGEHKKGILRKTLYGPIDDSVPSSHLQSHNNVIVIADKLALSE